jgi:tRNA dimethylallyltransferase
MHTQLAAVDPITAARLMPRDRQRIQRAWEIYLISGQPMSALLQRTTMPDTTPNAPHPYVTISLEPADRAGLHTRIMQRFDAMLAQGLIDEVATLHARDDLHLGLPAMRCVGYKQVWAYLKGEISLSEARAQAIAATRQLAKRQLTWLRAQPERVIIDCLDTQAATKVIQAYEHLRGTPPTR